MGPLGYHLVCKHSHYKGVRKREREGYKNVVEKIMFENFSLEFANNVFSLTEK